MCTEHQINLRSSWWHLTLEESQNIIADTCGNSPLALTVAGLNNRLDTMNTKWKRKHVADERSSVVFSLSMFIFTEWKRTINGPGLVRLRCKDNSWKPFFVPPLIESCRKIQVQVSGSHTNVCSSFEFSNIHRQGTQRERKIETDHFCPLLLLSLSGQRWWLLCDHHA